MSLYALAGGERIRAARDGAREAGCADCGQPMIAKTGDVVIWHWAHRTENPHCEAAGETEWHLGWKELGPPGSQERSVGNRRADVLAPGGFAVEFQKSPLTAAEVTAREADWKTRLVWVFDAADAYAEERLTLRVNPGKGIGDAYRNIRWAHAPERIRAAQCRSLLDLGEDELIFVGRWYDSSPLQGYGWIVTREWVTVNVLHGDVIPEPPGFAQPVSFQQVALKADREAARLAQAAEAGRDLLLPPSRRDSTTARAWVRCGSPRLWEPDGERRLCTDCGRLTGRHDAGGRPRCRGALPSEPAWMTLAREHLGAEVIA